MKYLKFIILFIFCFFSFFANAENLNNELLNKISKNIRCLICQGQSVYDSQSDFAVSMKLVIKKKLEEGSTESQIYEYLKNQYGEWITYDPELNKNTFFLWLFPIFIFVIGVWLIIRKTNFYKL
jgi:cytochrome c-type biogenesis protein CcmH